MLRDNPKSFRVRIEHVKSGDDLIGLVDLGVDSLHKQVRLRLRGVDAPNAHLAASSTEAGRVRDFVRQHSMGRECSITVHNMGKGGWVVTLFSKKPDGEIVNVNSLLVEEGYVYSPENAHHG